MHAQTYAYADIYKKIHAAETTSVIPLAVPPHLFIQKELLPQRFVLILLSLRVLQSLPHTDRPFSMEFSCGTFVKPEAIPLKCI